MHTYKHPRPAAASTVALIRPGGSTGFQVLKVKRSDTVSTYPGMWCLPGGFIEEGVQTAEEAAVAELFQETGVYQPQSTLRLFHVSSGVDTDPRAHTINVCFYASLREPDSMIHGSDLVRGASPDGEVKEARWFPLRSNNGEMAFDHAEICDRLHALIMPR